MAEPNYINFSGRRYPHIMHSFHQMGNGQIAIHETLTVNNDFEYDAFRKKAERHSLLVREEIHPSHIEAFKREAEEREELDALNKRKLVADVDLVEKTVKSYPFTKFSARVAFVISILVFYIQLAQLFKWFPFNYYGLMPKSSQVTNQSDSVVKKDPPSGTVILDSAKSVPKNPDTTVKKP